MGKKSLLISLDRIDRKILYELDMDSRQTNTEIAKKIGVSKSIVNYRVKNLVEKGIIEGFYTVVDTTKIGYEGYRVYLKWQYTNPKIEKEIIDFIVKSPITWWVGSIEGEWNLGFLFWVENVYVFRKFWQEFMKNYQQYTLKYFVCPYTRVYDYNYAFLSPEEKPKKVLRTVGSKERAVMSEKEIRILRLLGVNSRLSNMEIAKRLGYTPMIVKYNIKKLVGKGVIKGFRAKINTEKIGYTYYKLNFYLRDQTRYEEMLSFTKVHPNVVYVDETIGFADFEVNILVSSHRQFQEILEEMKTIFGDTIKDFSYFIYSRIHKVKYFQ